MPPELVERHRITVVPLTVTVDGTPYLDGEELDADTFYDRFEKGRPEVATSQPSPGQMARAYRTLAEAGAAEILSIHADGRVSGTVNAARVAAGVAPVSVRVVETATASFGVTACVREAAEALAAGAGVDEAVAVVERVGQSMGNVFVVGALDLARAGGRLREDSVSPAPSGRSGPGPPAGEAAGIPVLSLTGGAMEVVSRAGDLDEAAATMASWIERAAAAGPLRVGVGLADRAAAPLRDALEAKLAGHPGVLELIRYRINPSIGAHTGPGTVGAMYYPSAAAGRVPS